MINSCYNLKPFIYICVKECYMNIMFMKEFADGTPTNFREKILVGLDKKVDYFSLYVPKLHTMRESFRVKEGMKLDLCNWSGKAYRSKVDEFVTQIDCVSTQKVEIIHKGFKWTHFNKECIEVLVDDAHLNILQIKKLAENDGFDNLDHFFKHFNKSATYNLIHWTNLKY